MLSRDRRDGDQWTRQEIREFETEVGPLAERFGYRHRVVDLIDDARTEKGESIQLGCIPQPRRAPRLWRVRRATAESLHGIAKDVDVC